MKATLKIQNLKCGGCAHTITNKLSALNGIEQVTINHEDSMVTFKHANNHALLNAEKILIQIGYPVTGNKNSLATKAKSFVSCALGRVHK